MSWQGLSWGWGRPWSLRGVGPGGSPSWVGCSKGLLLKAFRCSRRPHPPSDAPPPALEAIACCLATGQGQVTRVCTPGRAPEDSQADESQAAAPRQASGEEPGSSPCWLRPQPRLLGRPRLLHPRCGAAGEQQQHWHAAPCRGWLPLECQTAPGHHYQTHLLLNQTDAGPGQAHPASPQHHRRGAQPGAPGDGLPSPPRLSD